MPKKKKGSKKGKKGKGKGGPSPDATYEEWLGHLHEERLAAGKWVNNAGVLKDCTNADEPQRFHLLKVPEGGPKIVKDEKVYEHVKVKTALHGKVTVFYFAACNVDMVNDEPFTPTLIEIYNEAQEKGKKVEVVYVPLDVKQEQFEEFFETMPWCALPMGDRCVKTLCAKYRVSLANAPKVVIVSQNDQLVTEDGLKKLIAQPGAFPYTKSASLNPIETAQRRPNPNACILGDAKCKKFEGGTLSKQYETDLDRERGVKIPGVCNGCGAADIYHIPPPEVEEDKAGSAKPAKSKKGKKK